MPAYRQGSRLLLQDSLEPKCASFVYLWCFPVAAIQRHAARSLHDVDREPGSELESKPVASRSRNLDILLDFFESYFLCF